MTPRKPRIGRWMMVLPIGLLGILATYHHIALDPYQPTQYSDRAQTEISHYVFPVQVASQALTTGGDAEVKAAATLWIDGYAAGQLHDVPTVTPDDNTRNGAKSEIHSVRGELCSTLYNIANRSRVPRERAATALMGIRLLQVGKRMDAGAYLQSIRTENTFIPILKSCWNAYTPEQQQWLIATLDEARAIEGLTSVFNQVTASLLSNEGRPLSKRQASALASLQSRLDLEMDVEVAKGLTQHTSGEGAILAAFSRQTIACLKSRQAGLEELREKTYLRLVAQAQ